MVKGDSTMTTLPEATPTDASVEDYIEVFGPPLIVFNIPSGLRYEWYPSRSDSHPHMILNAFHDGSRTAAQIVPNHNL
jgi:hypothetical protein